MTHASRPAATAALRITLLLLLAFLLVACGNKRPDERLEQGDVDFDILLTLPDEPVSFVDDVKPVLDQRCIVCHGCYDAPCQLKLTSAEGIDRGASEERVYNGARITAMTPTRMFIDARSTEEWRERGFYSVLTRDGDAETNLRDSTLYRMLQLKETNPQARFGMLGPEFDLSLDRAQTCPKPGEFDDYAKEHPEGGMPYALPNLARDEYRTLVQWVAQGSPMPQAEGVSAEAAPEVEAWETFLNGESLREQIMSRYIFEHLFLGHIHLEGTDEREFYQLVRSLTPPGVKPVPLATVRPFDDPGDDPFWYRLMRFHPTIVAKSHVPYEFSPAKRERFQQLFLDTEWTAEEMPSYDPKIASNPISAFKDIPATARYKFLLDDARFYIQGFIKGPVCRGQVALNVIDDHFWVFFMDADEDLSSNNSTFLRRNAAYLEMPAAAGNTFNIRSIWTDYWQLQKSYMRTREAAYKRAVIAGVDNPMRYIWDGDQTNRSAALTVFRHFDTASVEFGLLGDYPKTAWIIDFPLLERIHYLLVAGFDVYGNVGHQLNTRLYMEFLRMEGENNFLTLLPPEQRKEIRDSWYEGPRGNLDKRFDEPLDWLDYPSVLEYETDDPQRELYNKIIAHVDAVIEPDVIDRDQVDTGDPVITAMQKLSARQGPELQAFPDVSFVRVRYPDQDDRVFTVLLNKSYTDLSSIFEKEDKRDTSSDTLTVIEGVTGTYPNFFFEVDAAQIGAFGERFASIANRADYEQFVALYGIRRTNPEFWATADFFQAHYLSLEPVEGGVMDLSRYANR